MVLARQRRFAGGTTSKAASRDLGMRPFAFGIGIVGYALDHTLDLLWPSTLFMRYPEDFFPSCRADQGMPSLVFGKSIATAGWAEKPRCVNFRWMNSRARPR